MLIVAAAPEAKRFNQPAQHSTAQRSTAQRSESRQVKQQ
jgi:hypothetical protein